MITSIGELIRCRDLLYMLAWRDIRVKYKQSVMGIMWAILMPMIIVSAGMLVKFGISMISGKAINVNDLATVSVRAVPWAFFTASVRFATNTLVGNSNLITKIYFARTVFPIAAVFSQLFDFIIAACLLAVILTFLGVGVSIQLLWVPVLLTLLILFSAGLGVLLSALNLFYRDVKYLVEVILTFAIFFTPIFYDVSMFGRHAWKLMLNPVAPILEGLSSVVVHHQAPQMEWLLYSSLASITLFVCSFIIFWRLEPLFAERV